MHVLHTDLCAQDLESDRDAERATAALDQSYIDGMKITVVFASQQRYTEKQEGLLSNFPAQRL